MLPAGIRRLRPDVFVMALTGTVAIATMLPCQGASARFFHAAAVGAIAALFFLQGARLSREAILAGMTNWKLHAGIAGTTFVLFPLMGSVLVELMPHVLDRTLILGVLFLCALPSTVQSSIALTSIAQGNVAGAVCAATASSLVGIVLTPLLFGFMSHVRGGGVDISGMWQVFAELLLPFVAGHLLRPWIGPWAARNKSLLTVTDRGSILLVVYTAFSAAVVHGIWHQLPPAMLGALAIMVAALLAVALFDHLRRRACLRLCACRRGRGGVLRVAEIAGRRHSNRQRAVRGPDARCRGAADHAVSPDAACRVRLAGTALCEPPRGSVGSGWRPLVADRRRGASGNRRIA